MTADATYAPHPDAAWRQVAGHVFVITPDNRQHELAGEVELLVWSLCGERPRTHSELVHAVTEAFSIDTETASSDLTGFLGDLVERRVAEVRSRP